MSGRRRLTYVAAAAFLYATALALTSLEQIESTGNAYADKLSGNCIFTFFAALRRNELDYDRFYLTIAQDNAERILKSLGASSAGRWTGQKRPPSSKRASRIFRSCRGAHGMSGW